MFPACALMEELANIGHQVLLITDERGNNFCDEISEKLVLNTIKHSFSLFLMSRNRGKDAKLSLIFDAIVFCMLLIVDFLMVLFPLIGLYSHRKPDVVISFGGSFTVIPSVVAKLFGTKLIIYEQNSVVGKANRLLSRIANVKLCTLMKGGDDWKYVPSPVRKEFVKLKGTTQNRDKDHLRITVIGGSQGAASFASLIPNALKKLSTVYRKKIYIVQQVGQDDFLSLKSRYEKMGIEARLITFIHDIAEEMAKSDLAICRSGASTIAELSALSLPAILIPYPHATDDHQYLNALYCEQHIGSWVVKESDNPENTIFEVIRSIFDDDNLLACKVRSIKMHSNSENFVDAFNNYIHEASL